MGYRADKGETRAYSGMDSVMSNKLLAQQLLKELADDYLEAFPEKCDDVEDRVMALQKDDDRKDVLAELFGLVHSLKGTSGTYGFHEVSAICHQFEELIPRTGSASGQLVEGYIDDALQHVDLLRLAGKTYGSGSADFSEIHSQLRTLGARLHQNTRRALVVDPSALVLSIVRNSLESVGLDVSTCSCGYEALGHLLRSQYDILITAYNLPLLNGPALLTASRGAGAASKDAHAILVHSASRDEGSRAPGFDLILAKDSETPARLRSHLLELGAG